MKRVFAWIDSFVNRLAKNYTLWTIGLIVIAALIGFLAYSRVFPRLPQPPVYANYIELQPEWSKERRQRYYQTSQGSLVIPYPWFKALESRTSNELFSSPEIQGRYGLLPNNDPTYNPDQMPVGLVREKVRPEAVNLLGEGHPEWASISCAACHTGELMYKGNALRVDGGQGFWGFEQWSGDLVFSMILTSSVPSRFERFCSRVYGHGEGGKCSKDEVHSLRAQMKKYFESDLIIGGLNETINHTYLTKEGFTRTAALGRGVNGQFGPLDYRNVSENSGPVSYPPLWYTHDYDWVQSPAAIRQPLARNVTEAWGVSVRVNTDPTDPSTFLSSTARMDDMFWMETLLSTLEAPKWPEQLFGPIDRERAERGRRLFHEAVWPNALPASQIELPQGTNMGGPNPKRPTTGYCARCHAPAPEPDPNPYKVLQLPMYDMKKMGTDKYDAEQFAARTKIYTGKLKPLYDGKETVGIGEALTKVIGGIMDKWFTEQNIPPGPCRNTIQGNRENLFRAPPAYPARPLDGYWATGPFLHNGSVRTLYELLSPIEERAKTFWIGTREFDPYYVGFRDEKVDGAFLYDTSKDGNLNAGHEFRNAPPNTPGVIGPLLTIEQRLDLIEYLKVLDSIDISPAEMARRKGLLDAMGPYYEQYRGAVAAEKPDLCKTIEAAGAKPLPAEVIYIK
jgi:hypothetical protein